MTAAARREQLGPISLGALVVASMIGTGVFTTSGFALADVGSPRVVLLAWVLGAVHAALGAATYGWLAARHPASGGEFPLLTRALHPAAGHAAGWVSLLAGFTAPIAAAAHGLEAYLQREGTLWIGATAIVGSAMLHALHRRGGAAIQAVAVALKLAFILAFLAVGLPAVVLAPPIDAAPTANWSALGPTLVWISFSYSGWNAAIYLAGEARDDGRYLARWSAAAVAVVAVLYVALNAVFVFSAPVADLAGRPDIGVAAAEAIGGTTLAQRLALLVALALLTSVSSMMMAGPRVLWAMGRAGALPRMLGREDGTPRTAIAAQTLLALFVFAFSSLESLLGYIGLTLSLSSALVAAALIRGGGLGGRALVPWLYLLSTLAMASWLTMLQPLQAAASVATLGIGAAVWWVQRRP